MFNLKNIKKKLFLFEYLNKTYVFNSTSYGIVFSKEDNFSNKNNLNVYFSDSNPFFIPKEVNIETKPLYIDYLYKNKKYTEKITEDSFLKDIEYFVYYLTYFPITFNNKFLLSKYSTTTYFSKIQLDINDNKYTFECSILPIDKILTLISQRNLLSYKDQNYLISNFNKFIYIYKGNNIYVLENKFSKNYKNLEFYSNITNLDTWIQYGIFKDDITEKNNTYFISNVVKKLFSLKTQLHDCKITGKKQNQNENILENSLNSFKFILDLISGQGANLNIEIDFYSSILKNLFFNSYFNLEFDIFNFENSGFSKLINLINSNNQYNFEFQPVLLYGVLGYIQKQNNSSLFFKPYFQKSVKVDTIFNIKTKTFEKFKIQIKPSDNIEFNFGSKFIISNIFSANNVSKQLIDYIQIFESSCKLSNLNFILRQPIALSDVFYNINVSNNLKIYFNQPDESKGFFHYLSIMNKFDKIFSQGYIEDSGDLAISSNKNFNNLFYKSRFYNILNNSFVISDIYNNNNQLFLIYHIGLSDNKNYILNSNLYSQEYCIQYKKNLVNNTIFDVNLNLEYFFNTNRHDGLIFEIKSMDIIGFYIMYIKFSNSVHNILYLNNKGYPFVNGKSFVTGIWVDSSQIQNIVLLFLSNQLNDFAKNVFSQTVGNVANQLRNALM